MSWIVLTSSRRRWGFQSVDILNLWFILSQLLLVHNRVLVLCLDGLITCSNILVFSLELKYSANTGKLLQRFSDLASISVVSSALMMPLSPKRVDIISLRWSFVIGSLFFIWSVTLVLICFEHKSLAAFGKTLLIAFVSPPTSSMPIRMSMHCTLLSKRAFTCAKNVLYVKYDASQWKKTGPKNIGLSLDDFFTTFMISEEANLVLLTATGLNIKANSEFPCMLLS